MKQIGDALKTLKSAWDDITKAVGQVIASFQQSQGSMKTSRDTANDMSGVLKLLGEAMKIIGQIIADTLVVGFTILATTISTVAVAVKGNIDVMIAAFKLIVDVIRNLGSVAGAVWQLIDDIIHGHTDKIIADMGNLKDKVLGLFKGLWDDALNLITTF